MLPIRESVLHLTEIAQYWSRELDSVRTQPEIYAELLGAFWQRKLAAVHVHNLHPVDRESVLKAINSTRNLEHPGFTLVESAERIPPKVEQDQDGSVTIDQGVYMSSHWILRIGPMRSSVPYMTSLPNCRSTIFTRG